MGKKINLNRTENTKSRVIAESIRKGVESYLSQNVDIHGFVLVEAVILSQDLRSAKICILFQDETKDKEILLTTLNSRKKDVVDSIKKIMTTKYFPKINFIKGEDEDLVF